MFSPVSSSSISFSSEIVGGQLLQVSPLQFPQACVQKSSVFLQPQFPPQPDLHLQNIIVKQYNTLTGIKFNPSNILIKSFFIYENIISNVRCIFDTRISSVNSAKLLFH
jgi:hypothetical protein